MWSITTDFFNTLYIVISTENYILLYKNIYYVELHLKHYWVIWFLNMWPHSFFRRRRLIERYNFHQWVAFSNSFFIGNYSIVYLLIQGVQEMVCSTAASGDIINEMHCIIWEHGETTFLCLCKIYKCWTFIGKCQSYLIFKYVVSLYRC